MRKFLVVGVWLLVTLLSLSLALSSLYYTSNLQTNTQLLSSQTEEVDLNNQYEYYAALPSVLSSFTTSVQAADGRSELIRQYLEKYHSPLLPYADKIVSISDQYGLDYRLMVAIAQCESNVCKIIPHGSYNCWGFGNAQSKFQSWEHALEFVANTLKKNYIDQGLTTPELMMPKYVPPSVEKGGPWARCVNQFMSEIE